MKFEDLLKDAKENNLQNDLEDIYEELENIDTKQDHRRGSNFWTWRTYKHKPSLRYIQTYGLEDLEYGENETYDIYEVHPKEIIKIVYTKEDK